MADDPVKKFFREDLSEAEAKALAERLESSAEDALRLGGEAEQKYRQYGLPEPQWPGRLKYPFPRQRKMMRWVLPWAGLAATAAFAAGVPAVRQAIHRVYNEVVQAISSPAPVPTPNPTMPPTPTAVPPPTATPLPRIQPIVQAVIPKPSPTPVPLAPVSTPVNLDLQPHAAYSSLSVVVKRAEPGPVTVRVLNLEGEAAVLLYEGNLEPGSWVFDWDGMLPGGQKAPAGYYQIQVLSGPVKQKKIIQIQ